MKQKILCPFHQERTPSCVLYEDNYYCWGCGACGPLTDVGIAPGTILPEPEPEDLSASLSYILHLPRRDVRGLNLPADERAYYVVWPDLDYYKKRYFVDRGCKYIGAAGHKMPWFWARREGAVVAVIEGEINALSVAAACPELAVVSPGGAGDFSSKKVKKYLQILVQYSTVLIIADADAPGAKAVIDLYGELAGRVPTVKTLLMPTDANDLLVSSGKEAVRKEIERAMGGDLEAGTPARNLPPSKV